MEFHKKEHDRVQSEFNQYREKQVGTEKKELVKSYQEQIKH